MTKEKFDELVTPLRDELLKNGDDFLFCFMDENKEGYYYDAGLTDSFALNIIVTLISEHDINPDQIAREVLKKIKAKKAN